MASHGPSFRFATPRPKEQAAASTTSSRLPLRAAQDTEERPIKPAPQSLLASNNKAATARSPAKLRRKYVPENVKARLVAQELSNASRPPATTIPIPSPHNVNTQALNARQNSRLPHTPVSPESVTCLVTPNPTQASGPLASPQASSKSNTLRRQPSIIAKFVSSRRVNVPPETVPAPPYHKSHGGIKSTEAPPGDRRLQSPLDSSSNPLYSTNHDASSRATMVTPMSELSATPSLRYTDSPSVFSNAASATPTSQTSYSPFIAQSPHFGPGLWNSPVKSVHELRIVPHEDEYTRGLIRENMKSSKDEPKTNTASTRPVPELAHLMTEEPVSATAERKTPTRPSRDDTPSLDSPAASPVVISNLPPGIASRHRRQSSSSAPESVSKEEDRAQQKNIPSPPRRYSHHPRPSTSEGVSGSRAKDAQSANGSVTARSSPALAPSPKPTSKFGFFHRKDKTELGASQEDVTKHPKKGPIAGTGHEGYGKYAGKGRNGSSGSVNTANSRPTSIGNSSQASSNRKSNGSSTKSGSSTDDFIAQRLAPKYMRGTGPGTEGQSISSRIIRSNSSSSADEGPATNSSINSPNLSNASQSPFDPPRTFKKTSATPLSATTSVSSRTPSTRGRGSWGSVNRGPDRKASKERGHEVGRREVGRDLAEATLETSTTTANVKGPAQEDQKVKKSNWSFFSKGSQRQKTAQKWGFFQKSQAPQSLEESTEQTQPLTEPPLEESRAVAHYAMQENNTHFDLKELEDLMEEADALQLEYQSDRGDSIRESALRRPLSQERSMGYSETAHILASHLKLSPELYGEQVEKGSIENIPATERGLFENPSVPDNSASQPRQSRLAQVGRIPKVVSRRDRLRKLPDQSFSRPFAESQPRPGLGTPEMPSTSQFPSPSLAESSYMPASQSQAYHSLANQRASTISRSSNQDVEQKTNSTSTSIGGTGAEFLSISMRKNSDLSNSSSSGTPYFPSVMSTAAIPSDMSTVSEDEIWREYDDFIDHVLTPVTSKNSTTALDAVQQPDYFPNRTPKAHANEDPIARSKTAFPKLSDMASSLRPDLSPFVGTQRRSQILSGFEHPAVSPLRTSFEDANNEVRPDSQNKVNDDISPERQKRGVHSPNAQNSTKDQQIEPVSSSPSAKGPPPTTNGNLDDANTMKLTPKSMANLRFGALMTSKWLSFGRVLFSPGHFQLSDTANDRVLVVDGLGKDWSYYCALTYPNTTVYSLGPDPALSSNRQSLSAWQPLTNHRHFSHRDISANFPFPKNFFSVVVFRFPLATTESNLRTAICECKRVLQPGGYLEISSLDLDLTNMGNKARRAVRGLKTQMQTAVPDVCLKPISDHMQYLLGRRGFENLSRCVVGVPVAGVLSDSRKNSRDEKDMSFTELVSDNTKAGDDAMTKMVAKVGRWWYMKTHETCVLPGGDVSHSIWNDIGLLKECEQNQTTFRLLICYAQKPAVAKRRTVSL